MSVLTGRIWAHAPVLIAVTCGVIWLGLALRAPAITYHLLPGVVAASWPLSARWLRGRLSLPAALRAATGGLVIAIGITIELAGLDALRGPALVGGSAAAESAIVALAGAAWAVRATSRPRPGVVLQLIGVAEPRRPGASS